MDAKLQQHYAAHIKATVLTKGWGYLSKLLEMDRAQLQDQLVATDDPTETTALKGDIRAINNLFKKIDFYCSIKTDDKASAEDSSDLL